MVCDPGHHAANIPILCFPKFCQGEFNPICHFHQYRLKIIHFNPHAQRSPRILLSTLSPTTPPTKPITPTQKVRDIPAGSADTRLTTEEKAYDEFMIEHHTKFNQYANVLGDLFVQVSEDELIYDDDWHQPVERNLELMILEAEKITGYESIPEKFASVHAWMLKLAPETRELSESILLTTEDEYFNILEVEVLYDHLNNILPFVLKEYEEQAKIIPFELDR